ncbi:calcium-dependent phosphotriesterase [Exidia glandulosa HHB12029]|uniref:Calcium-dependent phosphotriesterase n=1 Tax=Exidia glandulosa HHB12029 TaxID=1314781 RepID=A0A165IN05_EXIGL|nr:calcium-dependent phosphotriesterase [Exidia glandulosa HHB12029]
MPSTRMLVAGLGALSVVPFAFVFDILRTMGAFRTIQLTGTRDCITVPELKACEDLWLHQPTGLVYLACSPRPRYRQDWLNWDVQDRPGPDFYDYFATYDQSTGVVTRLEVSGKGFDASRTVSLHGMDIVPSKDDPQLLYVYVVNHRLKDVADAGTDSVIDVFKTRLGSKKLEHLRTFRDPAVIIAPNNVVGSPDGKSFYFTNSEEKQVSWRRALPRAWVLFRATSTIGFCHLDHGCSFVARDMHGNNGIARVPGNDTIYVASQGKPYITVLTPREDNTLTIVGKIHTGLPMDNLSIDKNGAIWAAAFPRSMSMVDCMADPTTKTLSPSTVLKVTRRNASDEYNVEKVFEDDGSLVTTMTVAVHDAERGRLFMHGVLSEWLTVCKL